MKAIKTLLKKLKTRMLNITTNNTRTSQKLKNKGLSSIKKDIRK